VARRATSIGKPPAAHSDRAGSGHAPAAATAGGRVRERPWAGDEAARSVALGRERLQVERQRPAPAEPSGARAGSPRSAPRAGRSPGRRARAARRLPRADSMCVSGMQSPSSAAAGRWSSRSAPADRSRGAVDLEDLDRRVLELPPPTRTPDPPGSTAAPATAADRPSQASVAGRRPQPPPSRELANCTSSRSLAGCAPSPRPLVGGAVIAYGWLTFVGAHG